MKRSTFFKSIMAGIAVFIGYKAKTNPNPWSSKLVVPKEGSVIKLYTDGRIESDYTMSCQKGAHWGNEPLFKPDNIGPINLVVGPHVDISKMRTKEYKWIGGNTYEYIRDL